jgi:hypothetical protein
MKQPVGMPPNPQDLMKGQGNPGGEMLPALPKPPGQFKNMPVTAQDMMPQS